MEKHCVLLSIIHQHALSLDQYTSSTHTGLLLNKQ